MAMITVFYEKETQEAQYHQAALLLAMTLNW